MKMLNPLGLPAVLVAKFQIRMSTPDTDKVYNTMLEIIH